MNTGLMFSSKTDLWETPKYLFDELNREFNFTIDVAANEDNHKCVTWLGHWNDGSFTNGLQHDWAGTVWCNPPYGRGVGEWVKKAYESDATVVMLLPARTDTKWFHDYIYHKSEIRFIKGRLKFGGCKNSAPFPSMVVIFRNKGDKNK